MNTAFNTNQTFCVFSRYKYTSSFFGELNLTLAILETRHNFKLNSTPVLSPEIYNTESSAKFLACENYELVD